MAIGIDRAAHKRLIESLVKLSKDAGNESSWEAVLQELQLAYDQARNMCNLAELSAVAYNEVQAIVRIRVAAEQRNRKRLEK